MVAARYRDLEQARRLERGMAAVRWFGVAFGLFQVWQSADVSPRPPLSVNLWGYALATILFVGNILVVLLTRRATTTKQIQAIGIGAFCLDTFVVIGFIWDYSFTWRDNTWVVGYILPLEGALRFQLAGALAAAAFFSLSEALREIYLGATQVHYTPEISSVTFRAGVGIIVAAITGFMSRALATEAEKADDRAVQAEEAAHREAEARREVDLFHRAVLAGVAGTSLEKSMQSMAEAVGRDLGFEVCLILLRDEDQERQMRPVGAYGVPDTFHERALHPATGLIGTVASTGRPLMARDVRAITGYVEVDPRVEAKAAVPLYADGEVIGVLDVETWGRFQQPEATLDLLTRLADQISLVVQSARLRARQQEMLERLSELDRMKADFVAITSHELRTPLTAIRGFVKTMMNNSDRLTPADMQDFLQIVDRQSHRLARLVEDLLMASKIEAGELTIAPEAVAPVSFLGNLMASFGENAERVKLAMNGDMPESVVIDPYRVEQVLRNLLHNAMKFSPPGSSITLGVAFQPGSVRISVSDLGVGIAAEEQARVFERFHQAGDSLTRETEGAGLGLYITKRLVDAMGGTIRVRSQIGKGSTFTIEIPFEAVASGSDSVSQDLEPRAAPSTNGHEEQVAPTA